MSGRDYLHIWYETQLVAALFFLLVISGWEMYVGIHQGYLMIFLGVITAIGLIVASLPAFPTWLAATNRWLQAIFQPLALLMVWGTVTRQIIVRLQLPARGVVVLALIYYLIMFAPLASEIGGAFKWGLSRLCYSFYWFLLIILGMTISLPVKFAGPPIMQTIVSSHVVGALAFLITATTLMRAWKLAWPGLLPKFGWGWRWLTFAFLVAVDLVVTGVNIGGVSLTTLRQGLTSSSNFLVALCAGIGEETLCRFVILAVLLVALKNTRWPLGGPLAVSALLFGFAHLLNAAGQPLADTVLQITGTVGFGLFYLVVFLYTGQLWLTILMHFLFDWLAFAADGTGGVTLLTGTPTTSSWVLTLVELVFFILLTVWMMHGKRRTVLERHAQRLMGSDQSFGYRLDFRF